MTLCTVLPRPISSASMTERRLYHEKRSQLRPSNWYERSVCPALYLGDAGIFLKLILGGRVPWATSFRSTAGGSCSNWM